MKKFTTVVEKNKVKDPWLSKNNNNEGKKYKPDKKQAKPCLDKKNFEVK